MAGAMYLIPVLGGRGGAEALGSQILAQLEQHSDLARLYLKLQN